MRVAALMLLHSCYSLAQQQLARQAAQQARVSTTPSKKHLLRLTELEGRLFSVPPARRKKIRLQFLLLEK